MPKHWLINLPISWGKIVNVCVPNDTQCGSIFHPSIRYDSFKLYFLTFLSYFKWNKTYFIPCRLKRMPLTDALLKKHSSSVMWNVCDKKRRIREIMTNNKSGHIHLGYGSVVHCIAIHVMGSQSQSKQCNYIVTMASTIIHSHLHITNQTQKHTLACCSPMATGQPLIQIHKSVFIIIYNKICANCKN